jgi:anaerobic magnesium-protoporphyrin IX monomethyl ester cyclase
MSKILLINPNRWGRGITHIWIASHSGFLKKNNHDVEIFDATFYQDWTLDEVEFATSTGMFKPSEYKNFINYNSNSIAKDLQKKIDIFRPDLIFWSALSSHIHSEGEYVNIENGYVLLEKIDKRGALKITGGLQATASPDVVYANHPNIDCLIMGESEVILNEIANKIDCKNSIYDVDGIAYKVSDKIQKNKKQSILENLDIISPYDYDIFDDQTFYRPYNGEVVRAVDLEFSRGCIYSCSYCVETIIQKYYGFEESSKKSGAIKNFKSYLRSKSAKIIFNEIEYLVKEKKINLLRVQDTNFLTNDSKILNELAEKIYNSKLNFKMYIETRPEGINDNSVELLKKLKVDGVGMGVELAEEDFREKSLNRFASQSKTIEAFKILKKANIKRTSYNVIGFPSQDEKSIYETIDFNKLIEPDNITVAYYSPYYGTVQQQKGVKENIFKDYEKNADAALRTTSKSNFLSSEKLNFFKENFVKLSRS